MSPLTQKGADMNDMKKFLEENESFREYVAKNMDTYDRTLDEILASPITQNYYESLQPGGCNYKPEQEGGN